MPAEKLMENSRLKPVLMVNNSSSQALVNQNCKLRNNDSEESIEMKHGSNVKSPNYITRSDWLTLVILTFVNLINYMDRYTIAGKFFH